MRLGDFDIGQVVPILGGALTPFLSDTLMQNYSTLEIRSTVSPPVLMNMSDLLDRKAPPSPISQFLKPTMILTDRAGKQTVLAPYGVAENGSAWPGVMLLATILGTGFVLGRLSKKR